MQISKSQQYIWLLQHKIGLPIIVSILLFLASAIIYFSHIQPSKANLVELTERVQVGLASSNKPTHSAPLMHPQDELNAFYSHFPAQVLMTGQVQQLFDTATASDLLLENGSYTFTPSEGNKLARCEVQLPLKGSYDQVQAFVANVLHRIPNIALSAIDIKRQKISDSVVDSQIRFTLYYRES